MPFTSCMILACSRLMAGIFLKALTTIVHIDFASDALSPCGLLLECIEVKSSIIRTKSHLCSIASSWMKCLNNLQWFSDNDLAMVFSVFLTDVQERPTMCCVSLPSWFILQLLSQRAWSVLHCLTQTVAKVVNNWLSPFLGKINTLCRVPCRCNCIKNNIKNICCPSWDAEFSEHFRLVDVDSLVSY